MLDDSGRDITYRGGPTRAVIEEVFRRTKFDREGRKYYVNAVGEIRRLAGKRAYEDFNTLIDKVRSRATTIQT